MEEVSRIPTKTCLLGRRPVLHHHDELRVILTSKFYIVLNFQNYLHTSLNLTSILLQVLVDVLAVHVSASQTPVVACSCSPFHKVLSSNSMLYL